MKLLFAFVFIALAHQAMAAETLNNFDLRDIQSHVQMDVETFTGTANQTAVQKFDPAVFQTNSWINEFELVIVINKANTGTTKQTMTVYKKGQKVLEAKVSTGREQYEAKRRWIWNHGPKNAYFSSTNTGYFTPTFLDRMHKSQLWRAYMPFSVFFDGGTAIHQAPEGTEDRLGSRASGGCVRTDGKSAEFIFNEVSAAGQGLIPAFTQSGQPVLGANGDVTRRQGYRSLVIVEDVVE